MNPTGKNKIQNILGLTPLQEGILFHYLREPEGNLYFAQLSLSLGGDVDTDIFEKAWDLVVRSNEMLRTFFRWEKVEKPVQIVLKEHPPHLFYYDFSDLESREAARSVEEIKTGDRNKKFDLREVPFRVTLCKPGKNSYELIVSNHHILYDGWSNGIILNEFFKAYDELRQGRGSLKFPVKPSFREFIKGIQQQDKDKQEQFWRGYLAGVEMPTALPIKKRGEETAKAENYSIILAENLRDKLEDFAKNHRITLASVFYTAWGILLQYYCGGEDVIFGTTVSGRSAGIKGIEEMVGLFINTLPLRVQAAPAVKLIDLVSGVEKTLQVREEFEHTPLVDIWACSPVGGGASLFDTLVVMENYPLDSRLLPADSLLLLNSYSTVETTHYDLTVAIMPFKKLEIKFSWRRELFEKETMENLARHFKGILRNIVENPETTLSQLEIISGPEKQRLLSEFNDTAGEYPQDKTLHQLFAEQVEQRPNQVALAGPKLQNTNYKANSPSFPISPARQAFLTYHELNACADKLAGLLIEEGVGADTIVALRMERSLELIIGILGILKAGGAYLPIDPGYPQERIDYMLKDSGAKILITTGNPVKEGETARRWDGENEIEFIYLDTYLSSPLPDSELPNFITSQLPNFPLFPATGHRPPATLLAYVIYTSGSSGKPKGVAVEPRQLVNFLYHMVNRYDRDVGSDDRLLSLTNIMFDVSVWEFFLPLLFGARLVLMPDRKNSDVFALVRAILAERITLIYLPPALLKPVHEQLTNQSAGLALNKMLVGVEPIRDDVLEGYMRLNPGMKIINGYGPTETTICASSYSYVSHEPQGEIVPIGVPLANNRIVLLDALDRLVPQGVPGELCISGDGVSRGYINNPGLTAEKFCLRQPGGALFEKTAPPGPPGKNFLLYKTGDLARLLPDGNFLFIGRKDNQLKIRGYRIEPGEIENRLLKHPEIREAVVLAQEDAGGDKYLAAYVVANRELGDAELRDHLLTDLPDYMIPSCFVKLDRIPLTPNGKIDRGVLPKPGLRARENFTAPRDEIEAKLVGLWSEVLARGELPGSQEQKSLGIDDNFFQRGGHSLKATLLLAKIHKAFHVKVPLAEVFKTPTIRGLAGYLKTAVKDRYVSLEPVEQREYYALSSAQKRLYVLQRLDEQGIGYNIPFFSVLAGEINKDKLEHTFRQLIEQHESLRTSFHLINNKPVQRIHGNVEFKIDKSFAELFQKRLPEGPPEAMIKSLLRPFALSFAPLLRVKLIKIEEGKHLLMVDMHHIITDETSMNLMLKDFLALNQGENLPPLRVQYKDFSRWRDRERQRESIKRQEAYWLKEFTGEIPVLELPTDYSRPSVQSFAGSRIPFQLTKETTAALKRLALETGSTVYIVLLALYTAFLAKVTNQEDIVVGSPIAGRRHGDLQKIIGMFVNTLPLRNHPSGAKTFTGFLHEVKEKTLTAFENQDYPFEDLVERVAANRDISRNPVFDAMLVLQDMAVPTIEIPGLVLKPYEYENKTAKFDLNLLALEKDGKLTFDLEYSTALFKEETARGFSGSFKNLVNAVIENPEARISTLEIISKQERERILERCNGAAEPVDPGETIHGLFEKTAIGNKDKTALVFRDGRMTYRELNRSANRLAQRLRDKGVGRDSLVGLMVERSFLLVAGLVGIMKAGGAYLPIDPKLPGPRKRLIIEDSHMPALLTNIEIEGETAALPGNIEIIDPAEEKSCGREEEPLAGITNINRGSDLAYVIFTSGSTGRPKGVMLEHTNLVNLIRFHHKYTGIDCSKVLQFTTMSFDVSLQEIFSALSSAGELYLIDEETRGNLMELLEFIGKNKIKTLFLPMTFLRLLFAGEYMKLLPATVGHIITAGEQAVINDGLRSCLKANNIYFHNHYGPSETHVITALTLNPHGNLPGLPSIGKPIMNTGIYILDKEKHLLPAGVAGELYAGGLQVGRGYLNQPGLTAERFVLPSATRGFLGKRPGIPLDPVKLLFNRFAPLYRTGDRARWLADGNIDFLGRIDQQVKIHGIRVEPGEIESQLEKVRDITDAVVVVKQDAGREAYLCAYIVLRRGTTWKEAELKKTLAINLPAYMIPAYVVQLDKIPLTHSGKIDRNALPEPVLKIGEGSKAPGKEIEKKLAALWLEVLAKDALHASQLQRSLGIDDNFFQLGGNSLKAIILAAKIHNELKVKVPLAEIFKAPSLRGLAEFIKRADASRLFSLARVEKKEYYALASAQQRVYILQQRDGEGTTYNMSSSWFLQGDLDRDKLENTFHRLIQRHESLRTSFHLVNEETVQKIHHPAEIEFTVEDLDFTAEEKTHKLPDTDDKQIPKHEETGTHYPFIRPFDLSHAPLLRVGLIKQRENDYLLMVDLHHIISDGMSTGIFIRDFTALYTGNQLPKIDLHYKDYAAWQNREKENLLEQGKYWKKEFAGEIPVLELPGDYARPSPQSFAGNRLNFAISKDITAALQALTLETGTTLYMILLSLYTILLAKLGGDEDIVIGTPTAGRGHPDLEKIMGMFVNTLALRNYPSGEKKFTDFIAEVKETILNAFENQDYPYEDLVEELSIPRDASRNPLFDTVFALQNTAPVKIKLPGLQLSPYPYENNTAKFDLTLSGEEEEGKLLFSFEYCTKLFREETIAGFTVNFKKIIASVLQDPGVRISDIDIVPEAEKRRLLDEFNDTTLAYPADKTIQRLFAEQVERTPDHLALFGRKRTRSSADNNRSGSITFGELDRQAANLALSLQEKGVGTDNIVGIMTERSIETIIGILGILKAGGAYLPMDLDYPRERIDYMLQDSGVKILVTTGNPLKEGETVRRWEGKKEIEFFYLDTYISSPLPNSEFPNFITSQPPNFNPLPATGHRPPATSLAYIIYTSGTTGRPKGTLVEHRSLVNLCCWHNRYYGVTAGDNAAQYAGFGFDASVWEIFPYLIRGAVIHIIGTEIKFNIQQVGHYYNIHQITIGFLPTQLGRVFIEEWQELRSLRLLLLGGDKLNSVVETNYHLYNNYGPTENTVVTTSYLIERRPGSIPLGKPIANNRVYIVGKNSLLLQPVGVSGELCIAGASLARGYLNRPELTSDKFCLRRPGGALFKKTAPPGPPCKNFLLSSLPLYQTGDLCKWLADGNIEFLGRIDHQVKIRGFRIELGEIEDRLIRHENVKEAVVLDRTDNSGEKYLCAYIVFREPNAPDYKELKSHLLKTLPEYMIPSHFLEVERIPLTLNGKVARKRLPSPGARPENQYTAPGTASEREIAELWKQVLGVEKISVNDNFFDAGGNSLKILKLAAGFKKHLGIEIPTARMLQYPTIASQAKYLLPPKEKEKDNRPEAMAEFETDKVKNRLKQKRDKSRL